MTPMSIQHPTPRYFLRWGPLLVVALGLSTLVWSCESEQTGYDVTLPLIGPMEFDEKSCEISDDVCSSDEDCVDENGLFVGPCTKTMEEIEPIVVPVSLSAGSPSYTLGFVDTAPWNSILVAQQIATGGMLEGIELDMTMDNFSIQGGPITIAVRVFSRVGFIAGRPSTYQPVTPSRGWKYWPIDWMLRFGRRGALRYHTSLKARTVLRRAT